MAITSSHSVANPFASAGSAIKGTTGSDGLLTGTPTSQKIKSLTRVGVKFPLRSHNRRRILRDVQFSNSRRSSSNVDSY